VIRHEAYSRLEVLDKEPNREVIMLSDLQFRVFGPYGRGLMRGVLLGTHARHIQRTAFEEHRRSENNYPEFCGHLEYFSCVERAYARI
jgi:hypothetical protein